MDKDKTRAKQNPAQESQTKPGLSFKIGGISKPATSAAPVKFSIGGKKTGPAATSVVSGVKRPISNTGGTPSGANSQGSGLAFGGGDDDSEDEDDSEVDLLGARKTSKFAASSGAHGGKRMKFGNVATHTVGSSSMKRLINSGSSNQVGKTSEKSKKIKSSANTIAFNVSGSSSPRGGSAGDTAQGVDLSDLLSNGDSSTREEKANGKKVARIEALSNSNSGIGRLVTQATRLQKAAAKKLPNAATGRKGGEDASKGAESESKMKMKMKMKKKYGLYIPEGTEESSVDPLDSSTSSTTANDAHSEFNGAESDVEDEPALDFSSEDNEDDGPPAYSVPIADFGAAILRGMGWTEGQGVGRGDRADVAPGRP